jgi:nicotinamidase/pyrazinamidase
MILWGVDVQNDFMVPGGRLYVPGAEEIVPNVNRLVQACRRGYVVLASSADAHNIDDSEFSRWPTHCVEGSPGAELIPEARVHNRLVIPNRPKFPLPKNIGDYRQIVLQKNTLDVFDNPHTDVLLTDPGRRFVLPESNHEFVVFGVVTEHCVRLTVEGLLRRERRVAIVTDAIRPLDPAQGTRVLNDLRSRGARVVTTDQVLALATGSKPK